MYDYDAFDFVLHDWIVREFVPRLEPRFNLYIASRDLGAGVELEMIAIEIAKSKRTLIVLSEGMDSRDVRNIVFVLQTAFNRVARNPEHNRIRFLLWNGFRADDPDMRQLDVNSRSSLEAAHFLSTSDGNFWKELVLFMPVVD